MTRRWTTAGRATCGVIAWLAALLAGNAVAQTPPGPPPGHEFAPPPLSRFDRLMRADAFAPLDTDFGPASDEELRELEAFAAEELPLMARVLRHHAARNGHAVIGGRVLPRVRMLRRLHEEDPRLFGLVREHIHARLNVDQRAPRMWRDNPAQRPRIEREVRSQVERMHATEESVLRHQIRQFDSPGKRRRAADAYLDQVLAADADISLEPPTIRAGIERYRAAPDEAARTRLRERLRNHVADQFALHADRLQNLLREHVRSAEDDINHRTRLAFRRLRDGDGPLAAPPDPRRERRRGERPRSGRP